MSKTDGREVIKCLQTGLYFIHSFAQFNYFNKIRRKIMKTFKKLFAAFLVAITTFAIGTTALAQTVTVGTSDTGKITISNASQGQTYTIYKLFDATVTADGSGISYKLPTGKSIPNNENTWFTVDSKGNVFKKENADVSTKEFREWAETFAGTNSPIASAKADDNTLVFDKIPFGYYFIKSSLNTVISVDSTKPEVTVIDKNETKPSIPDDNAGGGKQIIVDGKPVKESTAKIGDTVDFRIKFNATNHVTENGSTKQIVSYTITDTPSDLKINEGTVKVTVADAEITAKISKSIDSNGKMTLILTWADSTNNNKSIYTSPSEVIVTYSAVVLKEAQDGSASNSATIGYNTSDKPNDTPTPVDPKKPNDPTTVTTHSFTLKKTNDASEKLDGAEFKLFASKDGNDEIKVVKNSDGTYRVADAEEAKNNTEVIQAGEVVVKGLKHTTTYYLEEIKAPNGYNVLTERQAITVNKENTARADVVNKKGSVLPSTGAIGTTLFYIAGSILLLVALVYTISKRRMNSI